ncbi:ran GTPase-activating protein 1-like protein [Dinothrombium tinctorium]|uniref:Ran GTPase-activating protein 1-like protein n=1 Tax=Dinothrombium tinctorium TaxID=1965070 RepID=A0A443QYU0_9ACAR|nr:ran GTPase-activating protein 1-like protein [Dinothrombium tinctorium]
MEDKVSFSGKALKLNDESDAQPIVDAIVDCLNLRILDLEGNTLGIDAAKAIGKALESKPTLENANFKDLFTGRLKTEIPDAIRYLTAGITLANAKLVELDLSDNAFGPIGVKALLPFLQSDSCQALRELRLNNNGLGIEGGKLLATALKNLRHLEFLICGRNRLENDAAIAFGNALSNISTLKRLEMPQNGIKAEGIEALSRAIKANPKLEILNLNDNIMTSRGGEAIAAALENAEHIEVINFGDCLLRKNGCKALLESLSRGGVLRNVKELILNGNEIGGYELAELIIGVFSDSSIDFRNVKLDLGFNNFGTNLCDRIKEKLRGKIDLTLSDDEGSADEEGDEEYEEEEEEESENDEGEEGGDEQETEEDTEETKQREDIEEITKIVENVCISSS